MNTHHNQDDLNTAPMSEGDADVTQTMLQAGMLQAPARPGARGAVGRFEILRPLATGGMGQVFLAREPITDGRVAIKMIRPRYRSEEWVVRRFLTEAQHMYRMSHPNILKVMEVSDRKEGPYYVMPFVEGGSLAQAIRPGKPLPEDRTLEIARQVAEALQYAHSRGIIHRDLKPANVLLDKEGRAYLTDFGLLRTVFNDAILDPDKSGPEGTAAYMSPLAASGKAEDTRCDIYAFGAVLYEMLTGSKPYEGQNPRAIVDKILAGPPRPILQANPKAPPALARIAESCMARELRDRYAEMADVVRDLERAARKEEPLGPHGGVRPSRPLGAGLFRKKLALAAAAVLVSLVFGYLAFRIGTAPKTGPGRASAVEQDRSADDLCNHGWRLWREQRYEEAEKLFAQATEENPRLANAWNGLGWSRQNMGMTQNAREAFERCVALDAKHPGALNGLGWIAKSERKLHEAIRYWELAVAAAPQATAALAGLASTHLEMGQPDLAAKYAQAWLDLEPGNAEARRILAEAQSRLQKTTDQAPQGARKVTVSISEAPLRLVADYYANLTGKSVILSPQVDANRACTLKSNGRVPAEEAAQIIEAYLVAAELKITPVGRHSLRIDPAAVEIMTLASVPPAGPERVIQVSFLECALEHVITFYADLTGKSVILSPQVEADKPCTLRSNGPVPVEEATQLIEIYLAAAEFKVNPVGKNSLLIAPSGQSMPSFSPAAPQAPEREIRVSFRETPISQVIDFYAELTGLSVILSPRVAKERPCTLKTNGPVPAEEAARLIEAYLSAAGLQSTPIGAHSIRIDPVEQGSKPTAPALAPATSEEPPRIVNTAPAIGAMEVDPATTEIVVTFDRDMAGGFSWTGGGPDYPPLVEGQGPHWRDSRTCVLPVKLEAGRYYRVGINSKSHRNFRSAQGVPTPPSAIYFTTAGASDELKARTQKPVILEMTPANGAEGVDPQTTELRVTFSIPMGGGFSWTGGGPDYPAGSEDKGPYWTEDRRTCVLPVRLESNHPYRLGLNSPSHKNFQSAAGVPLEPVVYTFRTAAGAP